MASRQGRVLPCTDEAERIARRSPPGVARRGRPDGLIAAMAMAHGCKLVTPNRRDFEAIPGLRLREARLPG